MATKTKEEKDAEKAAKDAEKQAAKDAKDLAALQAKATKLGVEFTPELPLAELQVKVDEAVEASKAVKGKGDKFTVSFRLEGHTDFLTKEYATEAEALAARADLKTKKYVVEVK